MDNHWAMETWSLTVEEWFYFLMAILSFVIHRLFKVKKPVVVAAIFFIIFCLVTRFCCEIL